MLPFSIKKIDLVFLLLVISSVTARLSAQCNLLCNTDFENVPNIPSISVIDASLVPCWNTTATDNKIEVWHSGYQSVPAYSGTYFVELNANQVSTLYQNFVTTPGTSVTVAFAHRGRAGVDVMDVAIGPVGGPYTILGTYSDGNTAWGYYNVGYTIPMGSGTNYSLRFSSISAAGGNPAIGNFLDAITVTLPSAATLGFTTTPVACFGGNNGIANAAVTNGTGPFTYTWSPSGIHTSSLTGTAGTYTLNVTESNGCLVSGTVQVTQNSALSTTISAQNSPCSSVNGGAASVAAAGNIGPYTYSWTPGGASTASISALPAGTYSVQVSSAIGCIKVSTVTILQSPSLLISVSSQPASCSTGTNGSVQAGISGGSGSYSYTWTPGGANTPSVGGLSQGIYTVQAISSDGCTGTNTVAVSQDLLLNVPMTTQSVSCFGGSDGNAQTVMNVSAGPYSYTWTPGNLHTAGITNLPAGTYTVQVVNTLGCQGTQTLSIPQAPPLNVLLNAQQVSCLGAANGSVQAIVNNGTGPFSYTWTPGNVHTPTVSGLPAGNYMVQVMSSNGCPGVGTIIVGQGAPLALALSAQQTSCLGASDGFASVIGNNGTAPFTYTWSPGTSQTATLTGLAPGTYTVQTTDMNGCMGAATVAVVAGPRIPVSIASQNTSCFNSMDGSATATAGSGLGPYSYTWSPGGMSASAVNGLAPGTYTVQVASTDGCSGVSTVTIGQGTALTVSISSQDISCAGVSDGSVSALVSGTGPYSYTWTPGNSHLSAVTALAAGSYTLQASNVAGCEVSATVSVLGKQPAHVSVSYSPALCYEERSGKAQVSVSGNGPYTYTWMPQGGNNQSATGLSAGSYTVLIEDADHCLSNREILIAGTSEDELLIPNVFTPNGDGINDGFRISNACEDYAAIIYDRWGLKMFETEHVKTSFWNGKDRNGDDVPDGVYFYIITGQGKTFTGTVSLFR